MTPMNRKSKTGPNGAAQTEELLASAHALMAAGDLPAGIAQLQRARDLDPTSDTANYALGCAWIQAGEAERAVAILSNLSASPGWAARERQNRGGRGACASQP